MKIIRTVAALRAHLMRHRQAGRTIGLVPTMGSFHAGHLALMAAARHDTDVVVVSLFVNPTQFGPNEDLATYPRDEERDARLAEEAGVDVLFAPAPDEVYPAAFATSVTVHGLTEVLCGATRGTHHFAGVTLVVSKLFNMVQPDVAFFGQKDAQQVLVIKRMVQDLDIPVRIEIVATVREADGLAMSSRNTYLSATDRQRATALYHALTAAQQVIDSGERQAAIILDSARRVLRDAAIEPEYLEIRATSDLATLDVVDRPAVIAVAARVGSARLIDNVIVDPPPQPTPNHP